MSVKLGRARKVVLSKFYKIDFVEDQTVEAGEPPESETKAEDGDGDES